MKFPVLSEVLIKTPKNQFNDMALLKYLQVEIFLRWNYDGDP
jgi:hypothetical protein